METLRWPLESAYPADNDSLHWSHAGSNICLDFHGDPVNARLVVFSDGNHHMALEAALQAFLRLHPEANDIFYATTPPGLLINYIKSGQLRLGNLTLSRQPHVFISPPNILTTLQDAGLTQCHVPFMQSRGNVLLIRKGNPKDILGITDLLREDVRLFISNPVTEKASYDVYQETLQQLGQVVGLSATAIQGRLGDTKHTRFGELIHHREAPQCLARGDADVAVIYYHLALRYTRIFPDLFDFIPLGGNKQTPIPDAGNITTTYHIALLNDEGDFGKDLYDYMFSDDVTHIYAEHGLQRPL